MVFLNDRFYYAEVDELLPRPFLAFGTGIHHQGDGRTHIFIEGDYLGSRSFSFELRRTLSEDSDHLEFESDKGRVLLRRIGEAEYDVLHKVDGFAVRYTWEGLQAGAGSFKGV